MVALFSLSFGATSDANDLLNFLKVHQFRHICFKVYLKVSELGLSHVFYCLLTTVKTECCKVDPALSSESKLKLVFENLIYDFVDL